MRPDTLIPPRLVLPSLLVALCAEPAAWLVVVISDAIGPGWYGHGALLSAVHLLTLGTLGMSVLGAGWQLLAVVTARPHPPALTRTAPWVNATALVGTGLLVTGMARPGLLGAVGAALVAAALLARSGLVMWTLLRSSGRRVVRAWLLAAEVCLIGGALVGLALYAGRVGHPLLDPLAGVALHARLLLAGWIGGWIVGMGALLVPMFAVGPEPPAPLLAVAWLTFYAGVAAGSPALWAVGALLASLGALRAVARRLRPELGPELILIGAGFTSLPLLSLLEGRAAVTAGLVLFALPVLRGTMMRIAPFLAWAHAFGDRPRGAPEVAALVPRGPTWGVAIFGLTGGVLLVLGVATETWTVTRPAAALLLVSSLLQLRVVVGVGWRTCRARLRVDTLAGTEAR